MYATVIVAVSLLDKLLYVTSIYCMSWDCACSTEVCACVIVPDGFENASNYSSKHPERACYTKRW